ncbi:hypothetical protein [Streptomyces californicus]|uniref:hypothetical protein n=1 Tax=Streptomyces californicus TaxID=67351 RepID=UPI00296FA1DB|nr:hypothetical protein [Streptomyces californicus]MDW4912557.1 hypothetical protein [Streptomyces californicus]
MAIRQGVWSVLPVPNVPWLGALECADWSAKVLAHQESMRLEEARTYSFGSNATGMAVAAAAGSPPKERITASRLPSPSGFMVFADPIGHHTAQLTASDGRAVELHTPIVAASWSLWDREQMEHLGPQHSITWLAREGEEPARLPKTMRAIWVTFYAARPGDMPDLPDDAPVAMTAGVPVTAARARARDAVFSRQYTDLWGPLRWYDEALLPIGEQFDAEPQPGPHDWASVLYTAWQMMQQQTGETQLVDIQRRNPLPPAARKKARAKARQSGLGPAVGDGFVHVVDLTAARRPAKAQAERDAAASDGRRKVEWKFRWKVPPFRRMTCLNPRLHHDMQDTDLKHHDHREDLVPWVTKGPKDKPLRTGGGTTYTFEVADAPDVHL